MVNGSAAGLYFNSPVDWYNQISRGERQIINSNGTYMTNFTSTTNMGANGTAYGTGCYINYAGLY